MKMKIVVALGVVLSGAQPGFSDSAVWQWSVPVESVKSPETDAPPRAFLWIPPNCQRVRAVIVGQHNMLEEPILEHPVLRETLGDIGIAEVWVTPAFNPIFRFDQGAGEQFQGMMKALATESGYSELEFAPVVPIGHSAMASYPYHFAAWNPSRTLAAISVKGTWPDFRNGDSPPWKDADLDGVPMLFANGEYEDAQGRAGRAADFRRHNPKSPLTMAVDSGGGHFDTHTKLAAYIALYLRKAAQFRLPETAPLDAPVTLKTIDPTTTGWLYDRWRKDQNPKAPGAPIGQYAGSKDEAFWAFDEELTRASEAFHAEYSGMKAQLLGFVQNGELLPQNPALHQQVNLQFLPQADGITFNLNGVFLDKVPPGRPVGWSGFPEGSPIGHAADATGISIDRIAGPVEKLDENTFRVNFTRVGTNNKMRSRDIWLMATHRGDAQYKRAVQQALLNIPLRNTKGAEQLITFPEIPSQKSGMLSVQLHAVSSLGAKVRYFVREGPAEVEGDTLKFTAIPPRAKFPVAVTVTAWQYGSAVEPKVITAETVTLKFWITK